MSDLRFLVFQLHNEQFIQTWCQIFIYESYLDNKQLSSPISDASVGTVAMCLSWRWRRPSLGEQSSILLVDCSFMCHVLVPEFSRSSQVGNLRGTELNHHLDTQQDARLLSCMNASQQHQGVTPASAPPPIEASAVSARLLKQVPVCVCVIVFLSGCLWRSSTAAWTVMRSSSRRMAAGPPWGPRRKCRRCPRPPSTGWMVRQRILSTRGSRMVFEGEVSVVCSTFLIYKYYLLLLYIFLHWILYPWYCHFLYFN